MAEPPKSPIGYELLTYLWVIFLSCFGGVVRYLRATNAINKFSLFQFLKEIVISGFVGLVTFFLCESAHIDQTLSAAFIAISGHMGSRAIFLFEDFFKDKFGKK